MFFKKFASFAKLFAICVLFGILCGAVGTLFSKGVSLVTETRYAFPWLLYLLPLAGILTVVIYKLLKTTDTGTNQVLLSAHGETALSPKLAPAVFCASLLSHLCGASVGREGAALQLGGGAAIFFSKGFKLSEEQKRILVYCGMAGVFSSVFGTPFAAAVFALEVVCVVHICLAAIIPAFITSFVSYFSAHLLGAHAERFSLSAVPTVSFSFFWKLLVLAVLTAGVGIVFCFALKYSGKLFKKLFKNAFLRIAVGGTFIIILTLLVGSYDYNGAGVNIIEKIFAHSEFVPWAFALKILFTCVAVGTGFKGGEIVPTLFIGATFGALLGTLLGLPVAFAAAVGMISLFCSVTNCPLASILLAAELFSCKGIGFMAVAVIITFGISGKISLYSAQKIHGFKKLF